MSIAPTTTRPTLRCALPPPQPRKPLVTDRRRYERPEQGRGWGRARARIALHAGRENHHAVANGYRTVRRLGGYYTNPCSQNWASAEFPYTYLPTCSRVLGVH